MPASQSESSAYDLTGNLVYQTNFNGLVITNQYDVMNRLTNRISAGGYQVSYAYNVTNGLRTNMTDVTGVTAYLYDGLNRLTQKTVAWTGGPTVSLNYGYDAIGSLTNLWSSTVGGVTNAYQYDLLGRLTNVFAGGTAAAAYGFDAVGNLQTVHCGSGVTNLYLYDSRNRLTNLVWNLNGSTLASFAYTVGLTGNRTALTESLNNTSRNYNWVYDLLYRMTGETMGGIGTVGYQFDTVGNRTNRSGSIPDLASQALIYSPNDWLTNTDGYDSNGNTTTSSGLTYQYDVMNRLTNVNNGAVVIGYDGDGNRVKKTVNGVMTYYLLDDRNPSGYVQVLEEWNSSGPTYLYNHGSDLISQKRVSNGAVRYFGYDGHGSTRFLTDTTGAVTDTYVYDAYGTKIASASTGISANKYLYCGEQFDSDLNFYYLRARYYKPDTGRFWTVDTFAGNRKEPISLHKYSYCQNDPVSNIDPSGHEVEEVDITDQAEEFIEASDDIVSATFKSIARRQLALSILKNSAALAAVLAVGGDTEIEPAPSLPDQEPYREYQTDALQFGVYGKCLEYARAVDKKKRTKNERSLYIAYRLKPSYNLNVYAPWGNILDRITGERVADNGFHVGWVLDGLVFDNWHSAIPLSLWPLFYEVLRANASDGTTTSLMGAHAEGFGQLKLFWDEPPENRYDARWGSEASDVIYMPVFQ